MTRLVFGTRKAPLCPRCGAAVRITGCSNRMVFYACGAAIASEKIANRNHVRLFYVESEDEPPYLLRDPRL